jgi:hypothetical protein
LLRVSLAWVVEQIEAINGLARLTTASKGFDLWVPITQAKTCLSAMFADSLYKPYLKVSYSRASAFFDLLERHVPANGVIDENKNLSDFELWEITNARQQFDTVFRAELALIPLFLTTAKGAFDIDRLIDAGIELFPENLLAKVPEAELDAMEAGRCLAFERNTACGFHTFRVVESVLRRYWDQVSSGLPRPNPQTLGKIATDMENKRLGDAKVLESIKQLAKLHRNPISHPDVILDVEEAKGTIGISHGVITHMLAVLPDVPRTTGAAPISAP